MRDLKRILPSLLISVVLIFAILRFIDVQQVIESFRNANITYLVIAMGLGLAWMVARTLVWRTLLRDRPTFRDTFITLNEGYLLNNILPFRLGEVGRAVLLSQKANLRFVEVVSTIFIERATDIAFSAIILLSALPFIQRAADVALVGVVAIAAVAVFFIVAYLTIRYQQPLLAWARRKLRNVPKGLALVDDVFEKLLLGLNIFSDKKVFFRFIFFMAVNWSISIVQYTLIAKAFLPQANIAWGMFTLGAAAFGGAIPSLPGAVGTLESSMGGALVLLSGNYAASFAAPLVLRANMYLFSGIFGTYGLASEGKSLAGIYRTLQSYRQTAEKAE